MLKQAAQLAAGLHQPLWRFSLISTNAMGWSELSLQANLEGQGADLPLNPFLSARANRES
jgi:hypothetical protein